GEGLPTLEIVNNGIDENCDGHDAICTPGDTKTCYDGPPGTKDVGLCKAGSTTCQHGGLFGACVGEVLPQTDIPNNSVDENCDGHDAVCTPGDTAPCYDGSEGTKGV